MGTQETAADEVAASVTCKSDEATIGMVARETVREFFSAVEHDHDEEEEEEKEAQVGLSLSLSLRCKSPFLYTVLYCWYPVSCGVVHLIALVFLYHTL